LGGVFKLYYFVKESGYRTQIKTPARELVFDFIYVIWVGVSKRKYQLSRWSRSRRRKLMYLFDLLSRAIWYQTLRICQLLHSAPILEAKPQEYAILISMRKVALIDKEFYHIYNRGVDKRKTFASENDYARFKYNLYLSNSNKSFNVSDIIKCIGKRDTIFSLPRENELVTIHAYVIMPNHFHLLLSQKKENGVSLFMQKLSTAYTMYFNKKNNRSGSLFQGTFKSIHVDSDRYLMYLFAYIHANPFSAVATNGRISINDTDKVLIYPHSSIIDYQKVTRPENSIVNTDFFDKNFTDNKSLLECLETWLNYHQILEAKPQESDDIV
jgi:putative transposase